MTSSPPPTRSSRARFAAASSSTCKADGSRGEETHERNHSGHRPGHHLLARHPFRRRACDRGAIAQQEFTQHYPQSGWVEHDAEEIWAQRRRHRAATAHAPRPASPPRDDRRHRHHQPARDDRGLGPQHRQADPPRHRLAGPAHRRPLREHCKAQGMEPLVTARDRPAARPLFLRHQDRAGCSTMSTVRAGAAEAGELAFGTIDSFLIWRLTGGAVHATDATNASRTLLYNITQGRWDDELCDLFGVPAAMLPRGARLRRRFRRDDAATLRRGHPHPRHCGRPAGGDHRPGLLRARHDEIDLWHRLLCPAQHRHGPRALEEPAADDHRLPARRAGAPMRWRARSSSRGPRCNGCATGLASSMPPSRRGALGGAGRSRRSMSIWCRPSSGSARPTGMPRRAARSSA